MTTIGDIAKKSGYSKATVSRVLNQKGYVSKIAEEKIQATIAALNYAPSELARDLSKGKTCNIGVVLPHTKHPYFTEILKGIIDGAFSTPYKIVVLPSEYDEKLERTYLEQLRRKALDGIIFTSRGISLDIIAQYLPYGPIVCCEDPKRPDLWGVYPKRAPAYEAAFTFLKKQNFYQVGILLSRPAKISATSQAILSAYEKIYQKPFAEEQIVTGVASYEDSLKAAEKLWQQFPKVEAVLANGDDIAAGVKTFFEKKQWPVPFLIGQERQLSSQLLHLPTIDHHAKELGTLAFELATKKSEAQQISRTSQFILPDKSFLFRGEFN